MACKKVKYTKKGIVSGAISASRKTGKGMRGYFCKECKSWHLTTQKGATFRGIV